MTKASYDREGTFGISGPVFSVARIRSPEPLPNFVCRSGRFAWVATLLLCAALLRALLYVAIESLNFPPVMEMQAATPPLPQPWSRLGSTNSRARLRLQSCRGLFVIVLRAKRSTYSSIWGALNKFKQFGSNFEEACGKHVPCWCC